MPVFGRRGSEYDFVSFFFGRPVVTELELSWGGSGRFWETGRDDIDLDFCSAAENWIRKTAGGVALWTCDFVLFCSR